MFQITQATRKIAKLKKRIRVIQGGTSAGKTISILSLLIHLSQSDKETKLTSVVSESIPHLKRGAIRDFKNILQSQGYWKDKLWNATDSIYTFETGSQIEFFSSDNGDKLRGARRDRLFMNEANNMTLDAFNQLEIRTKDFVFIDYNPTIAFWVYEDVIETRDDVDHIILTYRDNEALDERIRDSIEKRRTNKSWFRVYGDGLLGEVEGKIYKDWKIVDEIPHEAKLERYGVDFGYTNDPTAIIALYYYNGGYIIDEIAVKKGLLNSDIADILKNQEEALVVADSAEPKSIDEIRRYGINITGAKKKNVQFGSNESYVKWSIGVVQDQKISITKRSVDTIKSYRNYLWEVDKDGRILNKPNHYLSDPMDAVRYAITSIRGVIEQEQTRYSNSIKSLKSNKKVINPAR